MGFENNRTRSPDLETILGASDPLLSAGVSFHWLKRKSKAPVEFGWSSTPKMIRSELISRYVDGNNIGIRLGACSETNSGFLHVLDIDVRKDDLAREAWEAVGSVLPDARKLPSVISGSGGESRHLYILLDRPLRSQKLFRSAGFSMVFDPNLAKEVKKFHWEVELLGSGKQVVAPPSIHPNTGLPYHWEREMEWDLVEFGVKTALSASIFSKIGARQDDPDAEGDDDDLFELWKSQPLDLSEAEIDRILSDLPEDWVEDRDRWIEVGMALSNQYRRSREGFDRWCDWSRQSEKFDMKTQNASWRSFKEVKKPKTMASLIAAAKQNRINANLPALIEDQDEEDDPLAALMESGFAPEPKPTRLGNWHSLLDFYANGQPKSVLHNVALIVENDPRTFGCIAFNSFKNTIVLVRRPKIVRMAQEWKPIVQLDESFWKVPDPVNGQLFTDVHLHSLRRMIEAPLSQGGYSIKVSDRDMKAAVELVANRNTYHPVANYLDACARAWDGKHRAETLFIRYLGCEDTAYHREACILFLMGAVTRIFEPGHKFDFVPILEGTQGKRKSTFVRILARHWFSELTGDFSNTKEMVEQLQGAWIIEIPELQGFSRADANELKAFISRVVDKARLAYRHFAGEFPRQCVFMGSTNDDEYLRDATGGRRFWPVQCKLAGEIDTDTLEGEIDMIWGEMVHRYRAMRASCHLRELPLFFKSEEAKREAVALQKSRRVETIEDNLAGRIEVWLNNPIDIVSRFDDLDPAIPKRYRNEVCVGQVAEELLEVPFGKITPSLNSQIGKALKRVPGWRRSGQKSFGKYGRPKVYYRAVPMTDDNLLV